MPYSQFTTIRKAREAFNLTVLEGDRFLPPLEPIAPSDILAGTLKETLPIVATSGSKKARSEGIIYPLLLEVRRICDCKASLAGGLLLAWFIVATFRFRCWLEGFFS